MEIGDMLQEMLSEANQSLPFAANYVRYRLDFKIIPDLVFDDPVKFTLNLRDGRNDFICELFNRYYDAMNKTYFPNDPKVFYPNDFGIIRYRVGEGKHLICVDLPTDFDGSSTMCGSYVITYTGDEPQDIRLYAMEDNMYGYNHIREYTKDGETVSIPKPDDKRSALKEIAKRSFGE